jgi:hypothetical protein
MASLQNAETISLAALFASQGYIVVAPNYAGYDTSTLPYHPYLIADQQSKDMIDALTAARTALPLASLTTVQDNGKLFITGYSQGGYAAMATHRAMQAAGMKVTGSAPMSGPYALAAFVDAVFYGEVNGDATVSSALLLGAYQTVYGNIYANATDVFEPQYANGIQTLLPSTMPRSQLYAQGKLPGFCDRESACRRNRGVAGRDRWRRTGRRRGLSCDVGRSHLLCGDPVILRGPMTLSMRRARSLHAGKTLLRV